MPMTNVRLETPKFSGSLQLGSCVANTTEDHTYMGCQVRGMGYGQCSILYDEGSEGFPLVHVVNSFIIIFPN